MTTHPEAVISVDDLRISFPSRSGPRTVLEDVSLTIGAGEFVSLIGPSGCGKTTLLRSIADLVAPSAGSILIDGMTPEEARRRGRIGFAFQAAALLDWRTALDNVALPMQIKGMGRRESRRRSLELLERVGLGAFREHYSSQLSGGMQQRVAIARALVLESPILLMDEPFAALDEITRASMNEWLLDLHATTATTIVFVTHNIREAVLLSDRVVVMSPIDRGVREELTVDLPRPRTEDVIESEEFFAQWRDGERALRSASEAVLHG